MYKWRKRRRGGSVERIFEEIVNEHFPNLMKRKNSQMF